MNSRSAMFQLKSYEFRREREKSWRELDRLLVMAESRGLQSLSAEELARLPILYRSALSSLSVARAISLDRNVLEYLESLAERAYFIIYGAKRPFLTFVLDFILYEFPAAVRRFGGECTLAAAFLLLGAATGFLLTLDDMDRYYSMVEASRAAGRDPGASTESLRNELYSVVEHSGVLSYFAASLFTHNSLCGLLAFVLGILGGIPVFIILFSMTGLELGAMTALYYDRGLVWDWLGWVLPHGVTELFAITLCGGGGLALARTIIWPGEGTRLANLANGGREAGKLLFGSLILFFIAGMIEGIFRQTVTNIYIRFGLIAGSVIFWFVYIVVAGGARATRRAGGAT